MNIGIRQLGETTQVFRVSRALTQSDLAEAISPKTSRTTVALLEQGRRLPEPETLRRICEFLAIPGAYVACKDVMRMMQQQ